MLPFFLISCLSHLANGEQMIVEGPQESFVFSGQTVVLKCKVDNQKGAVQWMKNGFGLGVDRQLKFFPRYSMIGSTSKGEYNLQITNATLGDDDIYACQISEAAQEPSVISNPVKLTVLIRPTPPKLLKKNHVMNAIAGETVVQSCLSKKGKPPPRLGWALSYDSEGRSIATWLGETRVKFSHLFKTLGVTQESLQAEIEDQVQKDGHGYIVSSNLSFVPRPEDDRKYLVCLSQHVTFPDKSESDSQKLVLRYAPRVNLTLASPHRLHEGGSALLACDVDAKPIDDIRIMWFKNGNVPLPQTTDTLVIEALKMEDHRSEYTCQASNAIGTSHGSLKLDVSFGPRIMSTPQEKEVNEGETISFRCDAVGNPLPSVFWTRAGDEQIIAKGDTITIDNVRNWQQGEYICTAVVEGFKHASMSHFLHIRGAPVISAPAEVMANTGESTEMSCRISGRPKPLEIHWTKDGEQLNYATGRAQVHQIPRSYGVESRLTVKDIRDTDMGIYNCTASNGMASNSKGVHLKRRGMTDVLASVQSTTLIALAAFLLMVLLFFCSCLIRRKHELSNKGIKFVDDPCDVTVKCEVLDGSFYSAMYNCSPEAGNVVSSKDYVSIPQNSPDLDYIQATTFPNPLYPKCVNSSSNDYNGMCARYEQSYGSLASGVSTPIGFSDMYVVSAEKGQGLETLHEIDTPKTSIHDLMPSPDKIRPPSRASTHV
ncbi:Synaptogenesis protein syg-1 [Trichostrongylus colubriformis]|uniref:Synaptogenesis protein syg-1 n=1 Tax=Trichostrongylus colubriformis TaxID=6319 RepID=A0AAN8INI6_TRICO